MDFKLALSVLEQGLKLWNTKEGRKYLDRVIKLKKEWYEEFNRSDRSQLALDNISRELRIIAETFANNLGQNGHSDS
jgi:hypothetical protein